MNTNTIYDVVILGGGIAGWLTSLFVQKIYPNLKIILIENSEHLPIIAGESGASTFNDILNYLNIDIQDFQKKTNATPKLGGKFYNWSEKTDFIHSLQTDYSPWLDNYEKFDNDFSFKSMNSFLQKERAGYFLELQCIQNKIPLAKLFFANLFIEQNKVPNFNDSRVPVMWHYESRATAAYLKEISITRGIIYKDAIFVGAERKTDNGDISFLHLKNGEKIYSKWFFDCTGFARLLLGNTLHELLIDNSCYFPAHSVVAWWGETEPNVVTKAFAMDYGWSWNVNLKSRNGSGYIYDSNFTNLDAAIQEAEKTFNKKINPVANFTYQPGFMEKTWKNNVIGIGLSTGFLEPLEANGIALICESLFALDDLWDPYEFNSKLQDRYNERLFTITVDIRDFLLLHYTGKKTNTNFWNTYINEINLSESLKEKIYLLTEHVNHFKEKPFFNGYSPTAWLMVMQGLNYFDKDYNIDDSVKNNFYNVLNTIIDIYSKDVENNITITEWLNKERYN